MNKLKIIGVGLLFCFSVVNAQKETIHLWPNGAPGAIKDPAYKPVIDSSKIAPNSNKYWMWEKYVSDPTIDVYPAPAGKANGTAVLICPGGGYALLAIRHEGSKVAQWLNTLGITGIVLKYRLPDTAIMKNKSIGPLQDVQRAMRIVRRHAKAWHINPDKIGIMGFSAGGHVAASLSTLYNDKVYKPIDATSAKPDFSLLIYPVISMEASITHMGSRINLLGKHPSPELVKHFSTELQVNASTPPAFLVQSMDDPIVPVQNSISYALALKKYHIPVELHLYEHGGHGYGLGRSHDTESTWPKACENWLKARGFL